MRIIAIVLVMALCATQSFAKAKRIEISKENQANSPVEYSVTVEPTGNRDGYVLVQLKFSVEQEELTDLWKVYLLVLTDEKTVLGVPLDMNYSKDKKTIDIHYYGHVDTIRQGKIAIRCGEYAPLVETIYQIDIGSYLKKD